ncbi:lipid A-modifier LpxR family protein [Roseovarius sp. SYSU LYC5161]|uniref:lipid A-modifier LpxR family protein n=1 Tax=Roseovarius halophilus (ex Wu et al. 2025) TaxID=3376060 RepID=UPI00399AAA61
MNRFLAAACMALAILPAAAFAEERQYLGHGRLLTNDILGDGHDRWRSGSYAVSRVWGPEWTGALPGRAGRMLEFRINGETMAPQNLKTPAPGDRPFAGALSFGLHSHFAAGAAEMSVGADLVFTGPQTGLDELQQFLHDVLGGRDQSAFTRDTQIGNDMIPTMVIEAGRAVGLGGPLRLRPFVEGRWGAESLVRAGADLSFGVSGQGALQVRAPVTGHRYRVVDDSSHGLSLVLGGDVAHVADSEFLPGSRGFDLTDTRTRLRAGMRWENAAGSSAFYGLTWLSEEFEAQKEGQLVGSVRLNLKF